MNKPAKVNARMRAPIGPRIARIEDAARALDSALDRALPLKALFLRALGRASESALPAHRVPDQCAASPSIGGADRALPSELAELASRICLWRVAESGQPVQYVVAGPDHDLRELYPGAVPLFTPTHRYYVRSLPGPDADERP